MWRSATVAAVLVALLVLLASGAPLLGEGEALGLNGTGASGWRREYRLLWAGAKAEVEQRLPAAVAVHSGEVAAAAVATAAVVAVWTGWWTWRLLFAPLHIRKTLDDFDSDPAKANARLMRGRRSGRMPPWYPNGWYRVLYSHEVARGQVRGFDALGQQFVAFRTADDAGRVHILDAYCPHLGANLAVGGSVVDGDQLRCPFHGWQFGGATGQCTRIPYAAQVPDFARTRAYAVREAHGFVMMYWNADAEQQPTWAPPVVAALQPGTAWRLHGTSEHQVGAHIQEIPENGADTAHLNVLHMPFIVRCLTRVFHHQWEATWRAGEGDQEHLAHITVKQHLVLLGRRLPGTTVDVTITQVGPGLVFLSFTTVLGSAYVIESVTPVAQLLLRAGHVVWGSRWMPRIAAKFILWSLVQQFERDVPIWNNKTFLDRPMVIREDGNIVQFRRWFAKFYPKDGVQQPPPTLSW